MSSTCGCGWLIVVVVGCCAVVGCVVVVVHETPLSSPALLRPTTTWGQLPMLTDGDFSVSQSTAMERYLAKKTGIYGADEQAQAYAVCACATLARVRARAMVCLPSFLLLCSSQLANLSFFLSSPDQHVRLDCRHRDRDC